ncbi:MAG: hypothetical protein EA342_13325 [Leptolyngbya sp. LCM1.Bin17]|nr:MAG: hypothetical protein EA342_13325 [Leptolyngbya sp. LCM1.Bin17]
MQNLISRRLSFALGLPALALASWLGTAPSFAAATPTEIAATADEPILVANLFDILQTVNDGLRVLEGVTQGSQAPRSTPRTQTPRSGAQVRTEMRQERLERIRQNSGEFANDYQRRRAEEAAQREARRQQREAFLQTLTPEEREAFLQAERDTVNGMWTTMLEGWAAVEAERAEHAPSGPSHRRGMSHHEWVCYVSGGKQC